MIELFHFISITAACLFSEKYSGQEADTNSKYFRVISVCVHMALLVEFTSLWEQSEARTIFFKEKAFSGKRFTTQTEQGQAWFQFCIFHQTGADWLTLHYL